MRRKRQRDNIDDAPRLLSDDERREAVEGLGLSPQQARIVDLILQGKRDKQIAYELALKRSTVRTYLERTFATLGVRDRMELALHLFARTLRNRGAGAAGRGEGGGGARCPPEG
jgi:DNA-binding NarL/FixJ family response regulator